MMRGLLKIKIVILLFFLFFSGYYLYFNLPWLMQYKERELSMITEYYPKRSLHYDIITGDYVKARIKILFGEDVNKINKKNNTTPLETALMSMSYPDRFIKMLVQNGADLNKNEHELLPQYIYYFGQQDCKDMIRYLIQNGADLNKNVLTIAVTKNNYSLIELLSQYGVDVNQKDEKGITPLMAACYTESFEEEPGIDEKEQYKIISLLINKGADTKAKDKKGNTVKKYIDNYRKIIENTNQNYTQSLYKLVNKPCFGK